MSRRVQAPALVNDSEVARPGLNDPFIDKGTRFEVVDEPHLWREQPTDAGYAGQWYTIMTPDGTSLEGL
jgi:hypothetical protein